jgi:hypothetical protein
MIDRLARLEATRTAARLASLVGLVLVVAAFGMLVSRAVTLDFFNRQPIWVADAIPAALSELYYGHDKRYTALESVRRRFFARVDREVATARTVNAALRRLEETAENSRGEPYVLLGPDDKGIVDLIEGGFLLFGLRAESIAAFYFALLALSCLLYTLAFWRSPAALLALAAFLGMFYLVEPMIMHNGQLRSILALRVLPILSIVACLHCLLFMASSLHARVHGWKIVLVALQVVLIAFTIHLRSTTLWQVATILSFGVAVVAVLYAWKPLTPRPPLSRTGRGGAHQQGAESSPLHRSGQDVGEADIRAAQRLGVRAARRSTLLAAGVTIGLTVGGYLGLQAYQALALPEEYRRGDEIATRVFWHNIFTGLAYHPELHERFKIWLDDVSIMAATGRYLQETGQQDRWLDMGGKLPILDPGSGSASEFEAVKFAKYDPAVKEMLIARCSTLVQACLETLVWYKPVSLLGNLAWLYGFRALPPDLDVTVSPYFGDILKQQIIGMTSGLDGGGRRAFLWTPLVLLIVGPFVVLLLAETRERTWAAFWACLGLALGSTIPTVVGYAAPHTIAESGIAVGMLVYLGLCVALAAGLKRMHARDRALTPQPPLPVRGSGGDEPGRVEVRT